MTIPDSLQTFDDDVFFKCSKLVPSNIDINDEYDPNDKTPEVFAHLRSQQLLSSTPPAQHTDEFMHTPEFGIHFVGFVPVDALMALRLATKG
ncbi:hypothetical protein TL16_g00293 [Triparma laevis f. inornata]|uniref:Uncharacterized protein n=1 Tax=Triparma laevis f. inornata TaxID=1714386 RepID=A0A9W6ZDB5_9STRA|nr:hypothetical protein TL16_g00293 [Triparma laevis f. inornata]